MTGEDGGDKQVLSQLQGEGFKSRWFDSKPNWWWWWWWRQEQVILIKLKCDISATAPHWYLITPQWGPPHEDFLPPSNCESWKYCSVSYGVTQWEKNDGQHDINEDQCWSCCYLNWILSGKCFGGLARLHKAVNDIRQVGDSIMLRMFAETPRALA